MRQLGIVLALLTVLAAPAIAAAQPGVLQGNCQLRLSAAEDIPPTSGFEPGEERVFAFVVENVGDLDAEGTFRINSPAPQGWFWSPTQESINVSSGDSTTVDVTVTLDEAVERSAELQAQVTDVECGSGLSGASVDGSNTATVSLSFDPAPIDSSAAGDDDTPWAWIVFGAIVAGTVVGVPVIYRSRATRVAVECEDSEHEVQPGRGTSYAVAIANEGSEAVGIDLEVTDVQEGWSALTTLPTLELGPDESRTVYMMVRAPEDAKPGDLCVAKLGVAPEDGSTKEVKTLTRVDEDAEPDDEGPEPPEPPEPSDEEGS